MAQANSFLIMIFLLLLCHSAWSITPIDGIQLTNFKLRLGEEAIAVILDDTSRNALESEDLTEKSRPPIELGVHLTQHGINLSSVADLGSNKLSFDGVTLELTDSDGEERCMEVTWRSTRNISLEDCFRLSPYHWYGGPEQEDQYWPIEQATFDDYPYITRLMIHKVDIAGSIAEPYWLNSDGLIIYVDPSVPLFLDQNSHRNDSLCLVAKHTAPYFRTAAGPTLKYTVCKFDNPRAAHEYAVKTFLGKPSGIPDVKMVEHPIWSTWAKFKADINEGVVLKYAKAINEHGFNNSQLEIDDMWETCYGSLSFNKTRFPDMKRLTTELNRLGFRTTLWVHPFINLDCPIHKEAAAKGYFVKNTEGDVRTMWWNGEGSHIDFTNLAAADWHETRLRNMLAESGVDSLKFDAGESDMVPQVPVLNGPESEHPEIITRKYVEFAAKFGPMIEIRTGKRTQNLPVFVRMFDRNTEWGLQHAGMPTVITTTFQMNLNGYPFVLPDMVGGNTYFGQVITKEVLIRYLQLNVFLPVIQFSIPPWDYDAETIELSKKFLSLHYQYAGTIVELMKRAVKTGQPINTPIWWVDPTNKDAHPINSEYMLGEDILVAPVLEEGATSRDIYLPRGVWRDEAKPNKPTHAGPLWLRDYPAPLDTLPYFTRISSSAGRPTLALLFCVCTAALITIFR